MSAALDLWGEPVPDAPPVAEPQPLEIPEFASEATREWLLSLPDIERQKAIRKMLADERAREMARERERKRRQAGNPLIAVHGQGPDGAICRDCAHLYTKKYAGTYHKCDLRADTNGPGTDHRVRWPACGRYEKRRTNADA